MFLVFLSLFAYLETLFAQFLNVFIPICAAARLRFRLRKVKVRRMRLIWRWWLEWDDELATERSMLPLVRRRRRWLVVATSLISRSITWNEGLFSSWSWLFGWLRYLVIFVFLSLIYRLLANTILFKIFYSFFFFQLDRKVQLFIFSISFFF